MKKVRILALVLAVLLLCMTAAFVTACNAENGPPAGEGSGSGSGSGEGAGSGSGSGEGGEGSGSGGPNTDLTYEEYVAMTPTQRSAHYNSFEDPADFFTWFNRVKKEYEDAQDREEIGEGGNIDLGGGS